MVTAVLLALFFLVSRYTRLQKAGDLYYLFTLIGSVNGIVWCVQKRGCIQKFSGVLIKYFRQVMRCKFLKSQKYLWVRNCLSHQFWNNLRWKIRMYFNEEWSPNTVSSWCFICYIYLYTFQKWRARMWTEPKRKIKTEEKSHFLKSLNPDRNRWI